MGLVEMLSVLGDDNITLQNLANSCSGGTTNKRGEVTYKLITEAKNDIASVLMTRSITCFVLWLDTAKVKAAFAQGSPPKPEPVAEVVSGYSGDPDSRGSKQLKALKLDDLPVGTKLYAERPPTSTMTTHDIHIREYEGDVFVVFCPEDDGASTLGSCRTLAEAQEILAKFNRGDGAANGFM